jgi:3-oxoacyl-[acyl-carrier protein] reductase
MVAPIVVGGEGRLHDEVIAASAPFADAVAAVPAHGDLGSLVYDATALTSAADLVELQHFFQPLTRRLRRCGRIVVFGTPPEAADTVADQVAQRALEGFTRSLGKEVGRGSTVQLVYVVPGAENAIASTLLFLLSAKSAYVSGQVIRVAMPVSSVGVSLTRTDGPLVGKVALVTGASRGIGAAIARTLHRDGASIVGVDIPQAGEAMEELATELGGQRVSLDITAVDAPQRLSRALHDVAGGVDIIVHNAGITRDRRLANLTAQQWEDVLAVNLLAPQRITTELLNANIIRPNGRVIAVSSIAGIAGNPGQTNYAASKAGLIGLVDALSGALRERAITVNAVAPGFIETAMTAAMPVSLREAGRRLNSMRQGGQPVDVAETVAWLADPRSSGVTGNTVRVCGQSLLGA